MSLDSQAIETLETQPSLAEKKTNPLASLAHGFALPFRALKLIVRDRALLKLSLVTAAISGLLLLLLFGLLVGYTGEILSLLWAKPSGWLLLLWYPLSIVVFALLFIVGASTVPTIATAPMLDPLSLATERALRSDNDEGGGLARFAKETLSAMGKMLLRLSLLYVGHLFLLPLWLLPVVGHALWTVLALAWTVFWLAYEYFDIPANRHGLGFGAVLRLVVDNLALAAGFGMAVHLILWIPLLNAVFIPVAAVGATLAFTELRQAHGIPIAPAKKS